MAFKPKFGQVFQVETKDGTIVEVREPCMDEILSFQEAHDSGKSVKETHDLTVKFLVQLGYPEESCRALSARGLKEFSLFLLGQDEEKKS